MFRNPQKIIQINFSEKREQIEHELHCIFIVITVSAILIYLTYNKEQKMRKKNIISAKKQKPSQKFFDKKNKKTIDLKLNEKDADDNPVYRVLRNQRDAKTILDFILREGKPKKQPQRKFRSLSQAGELSYFTNIDQPFPKSRSLRQRQSFREKAVQIVSKTRKVSDELSRSKKRVSILERFNKRVDKYCSYLPQNDQQQHNQSAIANNYLYKLCHENFFPTQDLYKRASRIVHFTEPKIPPTKLRKLKERHYLKTEPQSSNTQLFLRVLTQNF